MWRHALRLEVVEEPWGLELGGGVIMELPLYTVAGVHLLLARERRHHHVVDCAYVHVLGHEDAACGQGLSAACGCICRLPGFRTHSR